MKRLFFGILISVVVTMSGCDESAARSTDASAQVYVRIGTNGNIFVPYGHLDFYTDSTLSVLVFQADADSNGIVHFSIPLDNNSSFFCEAEGLYYDSIMFWGTDIIHLMPGDTIVDTIGLY